MTTQLKAGDPAPDFEMPGDGGPIALRALKGRTVVLYFYPKDDTSGCTTEAQGFTAAGAQFAAANTVVVGVSKDSVARHEKFRAKYDLTPLLGSDESGAVVERYGVWVEKSMYGRKYMGIDRSTFLIDPAGVIQQIWRKVKVPGHVNEVLEAARTLK
jgi:peroxiredoxin Q/BCP